MKSKLLTAVVSLVIAFALWMYVIMVVSPGSEDTYRNVPVTLTGERMLRERGLIVTSYTPTVTLTLAGNRTDLNNLNSSNIGVNVNVSQIYDAGEVALSYTISYPGNVPNSAITEKNRNPGQVTLRVENYISKLVDVSVDYIGALPEGLIYDKENAVLDYPQIRVSGPQSVVDQIAKAKIEVALDGHSESFIDQFTYTLCDEEDNPVDVATVETDVEVVSLTLQIRRVKEIPLKVQVVAGGGATEETSVITLSKETIRISGSEMLLDGLNELELGTINLGELLSDQVLTFPVVLPEGVTNETGVTEVEVNVQFPDLGITALNITNIQAVNVPEGLEAEIITQMLEIRIRGRKVLVSTIRDSDVTVTVDFSGIPIGTQTVPVQISIGNGFSEVGVVSSYSVTVTLREPVVEDEEA